MLAIFMPVVRSYPSLFIASSIRKASSFEQWVSAFGQAQLFPVSNPCQIKAMIDRRPKSRGLQYEFLKGMDGRRLLGHERRLQMVDEPIHGGMAVTFILPPDRGQTVGSAP